MHIIKKLVLVVGLTFSGVSFAGEFGDHCTTGLSKGALVKTQCEINEVFGGKTYCFGNEGARDSFLLDPQSTIDKAATFYAKKAEAESVKVSQLDMMTMENPAVKVCNIRGARF
jgi:YHS domain-containing protein